MKDNHHRFLICVAASMVISGCAGSGPRGDGMAAGAPAPERSYTEAYKIALLDQITVTYADPTTAATVISVTAQGRVEYPPDSGHMLKLLDLTPEEAVHEIRESANHPVRDVTVNEYQGNRVTVTGEVNIQTTFDIPDAPTHLLDAIAAAGGFTPLASQSSIWLTRHNAGTVDVFKIDAHAIQTGQAENLNLLLKPGDRIFVPRSFL
jgi:polysaccharide export outer membrane protein